MEGLTHLQLPTCTLHPPHAPTTHPPLQRAIPDITLTVKKIAQNPVVLAS